MEPEPENQVWTKTYIIMRTCIVQFHFVCHTSTEKIIHVHVAYQR
jgi:hypothetical protein